MHVYVGFNILNKAKIMPKTAPKTTEPAASSTPLAPINYRRGIKFAFGGIAIGLAIWLLIWQIGFIATASMWVMAWLTVDFYERGAGRIDRKSAYIIIALIASGVLLAILSSMVADLASAAMQDEEIGQHNLLWLLYNGGFWRYVTANIVGNFEFLSSYGSTILWTVVFALAGSYSTVAQVFIDTKPKPQS
jgi:hypothetical protein